MKPGPSTDDLRRVATIWFQARQAGNTHGTKAVSEALGLPRGTAARWLTLARYAGLLPQTDHEPWRARWADPERHGRETWLMCRTCRVNWPCPEAPKPEAIS